METISDVIKKIDKDKKTTLAFSGGLDSSVLLHLCLCAKVKSLLLIHINFKTVLFNFCISDFYEYKATKLANKLGISIVVRNLIGKEDENSCRNFKYQVLREYCKENSVVLTAHNFDDNIETLLFNIARPSNPLSWLIQEKQSFGDGILLRPLIRISRKVIASYAKSNNIEFCEDISNFDISRSRNFIRHRVIPLLETVTASGFSALAIDLLSEQNMIVNNYLKKLLQEVQQDNFLLLDKLFKLPIYESKWLMHFWLKSKTVFIRFKSFIYIYTKVHQILKSEVQEANIDINTKFQLSIQKNIMFLIRR